MSQRVFATVALVLVSTLPLSAAGRFGFGRQPSGTRSTGQQGTRKPSADYSYRNILDSPEKLTELFGPSILIRETSEESDSRFVKQPND